jgi:putative FmdB family regulatory protein
MPIYEFLCDKCNYRFERLVASMRNSVAPVCPKCQASTKRLLSVFAAHTKASTPCGSSADACQMARQGGCGSSCPMSS